MQTSNKLYKNDSKGKLRYWFAYANGSTVVTCSGIVGKEASSQITETYEAQPKNIGKKNETTRIQQAQLEVDALYQVKLTKKRYFRDMFTAQNYVSQDVQLAHDYTKGKNASKICWGAVDGQPKLDGVRCRIVLDRQAGVLRAWSRENKPYQLPVTMYTEILALFKAYPKLSKLDGEIYVHGMDFADIVSRVKDENHPDRDELQFWLYDTIESTLSWKERRKLIDEVDDSCYTNIVRVRSFTLHSVEEARKMLDELMADGYEGLMLRNWQGLYKCGGRSYDLQKWKIFEDAEFTMVDVVRDKRGHGVGVFITKDFKRFNARWKAPDAKRKDLAKHPEKYVNLMWTVRFQKWSLDGIPIFPVAILPRDYEA